MRYLPVLVALLLAIPSAHAVDWSADSAKSKLRFSSTAEGMAFEGQFKQFAPSIRFDPSDLASARFDVKITLASADTANADRDETLKGSDFFAVERFPQANYVATAFRDLGNGRFAADGNLSLRGVDKPVTLEFTWVAKDKHATLDGSATLNRLDFAVGAGDWADASTVAHEVRVSTHLDLTQP
jgi:polyisoprenoid-binding protein YceI